MDSCGKALELLVHTQLPANKEGYESEPCLVMHEPAGDFLKLTAASFFRVDDPRLRHGYPIENDYL